MKKIIRKTSKRYDSNDVWWENKNGQRVGFGYQSKDDEVSYGLIKCPICGKENYALSVGSGKCTWCSFNAYEE